MKLLVELIGHLAWPLVIFIAILKFAPTMNAIIVNIAGHFAPGRNIRARIGSIELESNGIPIRREELEQIVVEDDPVKRLELFKKKFNVESILRQIEDRDFEWLKRFAEVHHIPHAFLVWPWGEEARDEINAYNRLEKLGLVKAYQAPLSGGEWIGMVTDSGLEVLHMLSEKQPNSALERDAAKSAVPLS
ncbi:hypothetical protein [Acidithiobacillus thiooxidans]|uniref:hypothetical protein n=1 Tax=Acidithiobacillus thiooxidans TaxID=930 RepID=UPI001377FB5B|nr:hypothetical protein [Acidithiobacillus thiooxidans]